MFYALFFQCINIHSEEASRDETQWLGTVEPLPPEIRSVLSPFLVLNLFLGCLCAVENPNPGEISSRSVKFQVSGRISTSPHMFPEKKKTEFPSVGPKHSGPLVMAEIQGVCFWGRKRKDFHAEKRRQRGPLFPSILPPLPSSAPPPLSPPRRRFPLPHPISREEGGEKNPAPGCASRVRCSWSTRVSHEPVKIGMCFPEFWISTLSPVHETTFWMDDSFHHVLG